MVVGAGALFTRIPIIQTDLANASPPELASPVVSGPYGSMVLFGQASARDRGVAIGAGGGLFALGLAASGLALVGCLWPPAAAAMAVQPAPIAARHPRDDGNRTPGMRAADIRARRRPRPAIRGADP